MLAAADRKTCGSQSLLHLDSLCSCPDATLMPTEEYIKKGQYVLAS